MLVYASDKIITGTSSTQDLLQVTVYDLSGRLLFMEKQINSRTFSIPLKHVADQMVLVQVATERGVVTKKVMLY
ncbi:MAG: T9SS type A sorting domain-containing protein [Flavobacterium sp.]|nr:T9SS type A sorting domain-containing protein [Flavobacterium sp.]